MEDIPPLQYMPPNGKHSVVISDATFAWDKLKSLDADKQEDTEKKDEAEDEAEDEKEVVNGTAVNAVSVSVDESKPGMRILSSFPKHEGVSRHYCCPLHNLWL